MLSTWGAGELRGHQDWAGFCPASSWSQGSVLNGLETDLRSGEEGVGKKDRDVRWEALPGLAAVIAQTEEEEPGQGQGQRGQTEGM